MSVSAFGASGGRPSIEIVCSLQRPNCHQRHGFACSFEVCCACCDCCCDSCDFAGAALMMRPAAKIAATIFFAVKGPPSLPGFPTQKLRITVAKEAQTSLAALPC